jgi:hypothetical protein
MNRRSVIFWSLMGIVLLGLGCLFERTAYVFACQHGANWQCYGVYQSPTLTP